MGDSWRSGDLVSAERMDEVLDKSIGWSDSTDRVGDRLVVLGLKATSGGNGDEGVGGNGTLGEVAK